ncbi:ATP synthase F1 subunit delta [Cruoricaptor ignavus]|uniref:ATP synthase subunit delta n=1 Tax=Cruoricaptor ignavus TaxID=1118202 RepID=A0A7M1T354_9FLAO|nr:ATP synthase F1 subunit delta [Cruoricaptor ignavus]QOR74255.1 ATP synthase F1 subunit delta [Cruoricaptor ignavus]
MRSTKVSRRYAQGLLEFTEQENTTAAVLGEMKEVVNIFKKSPDLAVFMQTPFIDAKKKSAAASQIFARFSPVVQRFIDLVIRQGRESQIKNIAETYIEKVEEMQGVQRITLTSAVPLSQENIKKILNTSALVNNPENAEVTLNVDKDIIGGYILRAGDLQVDASVKSKLNKIKKEFSQ